MRRGQGPGRSLGFCLPLSSIARRHLADRVSRRPGRPCFLCCLGLLHSCRGTTDGLGTHVPEAPAAANLSDVLGLAPDRDGGTAAEWFDSALVLLHVERLAVDCFPGAGLLRTRPAALHHVPQRERGL